MKVLALISGGKDSIYNLCTCLDKGHEVVALGNLYNLGSAPFTQNRRGKS